MIGLYSANSQAITAQPFSFGNALQFDGVDDYVSFSNIVLTGEFSISMWAYLEKNSGFQVFAGGVGYIIAVSGLTLYSNPTGSNYATFGSISLNTWVHLFLRRDSSDNLSVYVNGVQSGSTVLRGGTHTFNNLDRTSSGFYAQMRQDEVAIWNTDIGNQSANLYNSGNGDFATNYSPANLQAYWRMNGSGTDTTAVDEQGNYDGTLNNFPASGMWVAH